MSLRPYSILMVTLVATLACSGAHESPLDPSPDGSVGRADAATGILLLGNGSHDIASVTVEEILTRADRLRSPRDLAFRPGAGRELWIANEGDTSVVISPDTNSPRTGLSRRASPGGDHFLAHVAALSFGDGFFATAHETHEITQPSTPNDFMGPTLWRADPEHFDGGHASHMDMLHDSPDSVGIEWIQGNQYWVFDGFHNALTRYDFRADHGPGGEDHSDGVIERFVEGEVLYVRGVGSHLALDRASGLLYVADTGNRRVAVLDVTGASATFESRASRYDGAHYKEMSGAVLTTLVDGVMFGIDSPSGLALHDGKLWVVDHATAIVHAFDLQGRRLDYLDLSAMVLPRSLGGIDFDPEGRLYIADTGSERILRISPR